MAKTWQSVIDEARVILQDKDAPVRTSESDLLAILNRGLQELARLRPDAYWELFKTDDIIVPEVVLIDSNPDDNPTRADIDEDSQIATTAAFNLPMMFHGPLVYWVASNAELIDDEFTNDGRAVMLLAQFKQMVVSL